MNGARGAVEILAKLATLILINQRLQGLIFRRAGASHPSAARREAGAQQVEKHAAVGAVADPAGNSRHRDLDEWCLRHWLAATAGDIVTNLAKKQNPGREGAGASRLRR